VTGETEVIRQSGTTELARFGFDNLGRRTSLTRGNGTVTGYTYDGVSRLSQLTHDLTGTSHDLTLGFTYNPASQIKTATRSNDAFAFTPIATGTTSSTVNGQNQLLTHGGATITHDGRGNITSDGTSTYAYNSENMLTSASNGAAFGYDPINRLYSLTEAGGTRMVYDDLDMIAEYTPGGLVRRRYVHGPGVDEPIVWYEGSDLTDPRYLHADERGSIVATSYPDGSIRTVQAYGEFGTPQNTSLTQTGRFGYTGQAWLPEVGLYYYKARIYGPHLGRFFQIDPIGYLGGMNLQAYVGNDPVNFTDPLGLRWRQRCVGGETGPMDCGWYWEEDARLPRLNRDDDRAGSGIQPGGGFGGPDRMPEPPTPFDQCQGALNGIASATRARLGIGFNDETFKILSALGHGGPSLVRITPAGMAALGMEIRERPWFLSPGSNLGNGVTAHSYHFAPGYEYGGARSPLGALLGRATVHMSDGQLVGVSDQFDYVGDYADPDIQSGVAWANSRLNQMCPGRQVSISQEEPFRDRGEYLISSMPAGRYQTRDLSQIALSDIGSIQGEAK
jgi:RHS repeat-associated protein